MTLQLPWSPETHGNLQPSNFTVTRIVYPRKDPFLVDVQMHNLPQQTADPRKDPFLVDVHSVETSTT